MSRTYQIKSNQSTFYFVKRHKLFAGESETYQARGTYGSPVKVCAQSKYK